DVAVHDAALVRESEAVGDLHRDLDRLVGGEALFLQPRAQVRALEQLHRQVREVALLAEVEGGDDVRMVELAVGPRLAGEALLVVLAVLDVVGEEDGLQRAPAVERRILGPVHHAHRPAAELAEDLVAADLLLPAHWNFALPTSPRT